MNGNIKIDYFMNFYKRNLSDIPDGIIHNRFVDVALFI